MHYIPWVYILVTVVYIEAWPCNFCEEYNEDNDCSTKRNRQLWSTLNSGQPLKPSQSVVRVSPAAEIKGMHNEIITKVRILQDGVNRKLNLLLVQMVPSSFYVDQYELQRLPLSHVNPVFKRNIDVELPEYMSSDEMILYYFNSTVTEAYEIEFTIPWHSRYHKCSHDVGVFHANATIPPPMLYVSCMSAPGGDDCRFELSSLSQESLCLDHPRAITAPCSHGKESLCIWTPVTRGTGDVTVQIPVGHCEHGQFVAVATLLSTFIGTVALGYYSAKY